MPKKEDIKGGDKGTSIATSRENFFKSKQKEKNSVQNQDNWNDETNVIHGSKGRIAKRDNIDDCELPSLNQANDESLQTNVQVGAFEVVGIPEGIHDGDEQGLQYTRFSLEHPDQEAASVTITGAQVVDDVVLNAVPVEDSLFNNDVLNNRNAAPKQGSRKYWLICIVSLFLLAGIVIPAVILTKKSQNDSQIVDTDTTAAKDLLENLKPLLTTKSLIELELPDSVPSLALDWLLNHSNFKSYAFGRQVQRFAMALFYFSTEGTLWKEKQGWLGDDDECLWYQTSNESVCVNGTLRVLSLVKNALKGFLPNDIALLSSLEKLDLESNVLAGKMPTEVGILKNLKELDFSSNKLSGSIPSEIGLCTGLVVLDLLENSLTGSLPSDIGQCSKLAYLNLYMNSLTGSLPSEIGLCTGLVELDLLENLLTGSLPSEIGQCSKLSHLDLFRNSLTGSLPSEIFRFSELVRLDLNSNFLTGSLPSEIGHFTKLSLLSFFNNSLVGTVPSEIGHCTGLVVLDLKSNSFAGPLPSEIGQCTKLVYLDLSDNSFTGLIPKEFVVFEGKNMQGYNTAGNLLNETLP